MKTAISTYCDTLGLTAREFQKKGCKSVCIPGGTFVVTPEGANSDSPPVNRKVHLAMSHTIDREAIAATLGYCFASAPHQLYPGYEPVPRLRHGYDPNKAKQLLPKAGYPESFTFTLHAGLASFYTAD